MVKREKLQEHRKKKTCNMLNAITYGNVKKEKRRKGY